MQNDYRGHIVDTRQAIEDARQAIEENANASEIMGRVAATLRAAGWDAGPVSAFLDDCTASGSYTALKDVATFALDHLPTPWRRTHNEAPANAGASLRRRHSRRWESPRATLDYRRDDALSSSSSTMRRWTRWRI